MQIRKTGKIIAAVMLVCGTLAGCGTAEAPRLEGSCEEILNKTYETAELNQDLRDAMANYMTQPIDETAEEYVLGTDEVAYTDSVVSTPMINVVAYQCVVLRLEKDEDPVKAKQTLLDHADPRKWVCVEPETIVVENIGDVVLYIMGDAETANAIKTAFLALDES